MTDTAKPTRKHIGLFRLALSFIVLLVLGLAWTMLYTGHVRAVEVMSGSMEPTIGVGDRLFVVDIGDGAPTHGQIVVLSSPDDNGPDLVKRVVGIPGDVMELRSGELYRNGVAEPSPATGINRHPGVKDFKITLEPGKYFVTGDNRARSHDSTEFGGVDRELINGYVLFRYAPWSKRGSVP